MNLHEIEEMQHEYSSEQQTAFAVSQMNRRPDGSKDIARYLREGRYVVISEVCEYCPVTDALMGTMRLVCNPFKTLAQAEVLLKRLIGRMTHGEECYRILSPK